MTRLALMPLCAAAGLAFGAAQARSDVPEPFEVAKFQVLPGWRTAEGTQMSALRIVLSPGWKTYWRAPGDGGIPPSFDWSGSRNIAAVQFHWPVPGVFDQNGMQTIGYSDELILPIEMTPRGPGDIRMRADLELGVCQDICLPMQVRLDTTLTEADSQPDARISAALAARPATAREAGVTAVRCEVEPISDGLRLRAEIRMPAIGAAEVAVFETPDPAIWVSESAARREGASLWAEADLVPPNNRPFALDRSRLRITVIGGPGQAVDILGCTGG